MTREQEQLLKLLNEFSDFCNRERLHYWLVGGTLLGAVRHKGFIPWDDDIDIAMLEQDYVELVKRERISGHLLIRSEKIDSTYPFYFLEIYDDSTSFQHSNDNGPYGVYIDVFPIIPSRAPSKISEFTFNIISVIGYVLQVKLGWCKYVEYKKLSGKLGFAMLSKVPVPALRKIRELLILLLSTRKTSFCFSPGGGHKGKTEFYPKEWFKSTILMEFEGKEYPAPCGWHEYLEQLYEDYLTFPDVSMRKSFHK